MYDMRTFSLKLVPRDVCLQVVNQAENPADETPTVDRNNVTPATENNVAHISTQNEGKFYFTFNNVPLFSKQKL